MLEFGWSPLVLLPHSTFNKPLVTVPKAPITIGIIVTFIFFCFFNSLSKARYISFFSLSFSFILWSAETAKSTILQVFFFSFFFFRWLLYDLVFRRRLGDRFLRQSPIRPLLSYFISHTTKTNKTCWALPKKLERSHKWGSPMDFHAWTRQYWQTGGDLYPTKQLCADIGFHLEDLPRAMESEDEWRKIVKEICATSITLFIIIIYPLGVFHISVSWWSFPGVRVTASLLKPPGLFSVFWPISVML